MKKKIIVSIEMLLLSVVYTVLIRFYDYQAIGPEASSVGFASLNDSIHKLLPYNELFYKISTYLGVLLGLVVLSFIVIGLIELIKNKSFLKVNKNIYFLALFYILVVGVFCLFEKLAINYRPVLEDGALEASFPSTHVFLSLAIGVSAMMIYPKVLNNKKLLKLLNIGLVLLMGAVIVTRTISGVHWATDIVGGVIIASLVISILNIFVNEK